MNKDLWILFAEQSDKNEMGVLVFKESRCPVQQHLKHTAKHKGVSATWLKQKEQNPQLLMKNRQWAFPKEMRTVLWRGQVSNGPGETLSKGTTDFLQSIRGRKAEQYGCLQCEYSSGAIMPPLHPDTASFRIRFRRLPYVPRLLLQAHLSNPLHKCYQ